VLRWNCIYAEITLETTPLPIAEFVSLVSAKRKLVDSGSTRPASLNLRSFLEISGGKADIYREGDYRCNFANERASERASVCVRERERERERERKRARRSDCERDKLRDGTINGENA